MERKKATDYPQELLNLFDHYVHGEMDRRDFLEGAKKFAVGGMTARHLGEPAPELRLGAAGPERRQPHQDGVRHRPVAEGNGNIRATWSGPPRPRASCRACWWCMKIAD